MDTEKAISLTEHRLGMRFMIEIERDGHVCFCYNQGHLSVSVHRARFRSRRSSDRQNSVGLRSYSALDTPGGPNWRRAVKRPLDFSRIKCVPLSSRLLCSRPTRE
ncbi:hypothetical protein TGVAND_256965 [Toxoplasma gondii VAND]|uniref:Uncharacterized protein n=1 Tax=Toxoplasma gondii VAND TaxID=933077 RepID=A0A086PK93_TOXGO|nr:hypothetical protein TGVAND_256965 [Toxoplasma gondii VAND]